MKQTHIGKILLTFGLVLTLFVTGVSAVDAQYDFDTKNLFYDGETPFIAGDADLILPVNLTGTTNNELVSRIQVTATVLEGETEVEGLTYTFTTPLNLKYQGTVNSPNVYAMTGMGNLMSGITSASPVFELNISGLTVGKTYKVNLTFISGNGTNPSKISYKEIEVGVKGNWLILESTSDNTVSEDAANNWTFTRNATVSNVVLSLPSPAVAGTYNSSLVFPTISGKNVAGIIDKENYNYTTVLNPTNTTDILVNQSADGTTWTTVAAAVTENTDGTITVDLTSPNADTKYLQITFVGKKIGDVIDTDDNTYNSDVNIADLDNLLQEITKGSQGTNIRKVDYIYADVWRDGILDVNDHLKIFQYIF